MTAAERILFNRIQRRAGQLSPDMASAVLRAFAALREGISEADLVRAIQLGGPERVFQEILAQAVLDVAFQPVRQRMRYTIADSVRYFARTIPPPPVSFGPALSISFDVLNPNVITAIRTLESRVMKTLSDDVREVVRALAENGLRDGAGPRGTARTIRASLGLAPNQELAVRNFERALRGTNPNTTPLDYQLRDKRYDTAIAKGSLSDAQITHMTEAYRKRMLAFHAETVSRTATLDATRLGQRLSWEDAADNGILDRRRMMKQRIGVDDDRERPEHVAINDQVRHFDERYSNGEMVSGDQSWNCRCIDRYYMAEG